MIKLIASDVDGTILQHGASHPSEEMFSLIRHCRERDIWFAVASGRQYPNLRRMFAEVWEDIVFVAENGALVMYRENTLFESAVPRALGLEVVHDIQAHEGCEVMVSGKHTSYLGMNSRPLAESLIFGVRNTMTMLEDIDSIEEPFLKISAYAQAGAASVAPYFIEKWGERLNVTISGRDVVDFCFASKGTALQFLQLMFALQPEECVAFGDNFNDVLMFQSVGRSFVMERANPELREYATDTAHTVEETLAGLLDEGLDV